ncbi:MAG: PAS domain-containing protein, partial [Phycisphaerales bacterium]|nr:PAS domain-containing protein [Phycisphaerales bacterium]
MDLPRLADWTASGVAVQPNNAVAIAAFGAALLASVLGGVVSNPATGDRIWRRLARAIAAALAMIAMAIGAATLCQHLFRIDLGIDRLLIFGREWGALNVSSPGRMGPPASICWTLLGITLFGTVLRPGTRRGIGPGLTLGVLAIALIGLLGSLYRVDTLYTIPRLTAIAPLTTVLLLFASVGMLAAMPWREPARTILTDSGAAGRVARVAILPLLVVAPVIGLLPLRAEQAGWFDSATGVVVMVFALSILPTIMLWHAGRTLSRHESELRASEALARRIAGVAPVILYVYDLVEHRNIWGNKGMTDVLGYTRADLDAIGPGLVARLMHPDDLPGYSGHVERLLALGNHETAELEYRMRHADGTWRWLHSRDTVFARDDSGFVTQILGAATDVTRRRDAEDALRQSQETLSIARDAAALGIHEYEPHTGRLCWDARVRELWGVGSDEGISYERFMAALHPDDRAPTQAAVDAAFDPRGSGLYNAEY